MAAWQTLLGLQLPAQHRSRLPALALKFLQKYFQYKRTCLYMSTHVVMFTNPYSLTVSEYTICWYDTHGYIENLCAEGSTTMLLCQAPSQPNRNMGIAALPLPKNACTSVLSLKSVCLRAVWGKICLSFWQSEAIASLGASLGETVPRESREQLNVGVTTWLRQRPTSPRLALFFMRKAQVTLCSV